MQIRSDYLADIPGKPKSTPTLCNYPLNYNDSSKIIELRISNYQANLNYL